MDFDVAEAFSKSRLRSLLDHLGRVDDVREPWRVAHPLREVLFLVVCGTICDCEDYDAIADWGEQHLDFLRRFLPFDHGVPGGRLAYDPDEPDRSRAVFRGFYRMGARDLARQTGFCRH